MRSFDRLAARIGACLAVLGATGLAVPVMSQDAFAVRREPALSSEWNALAGSGLARIESSALQAQRPEALNRRSGLSVAAAATPLYQCALNAFEPKRAGIPGHFRVQGRAVNICTGDVIRQTVTLCVSFFGGDKVWHGDVCGNKAKKGPGTIDYILTGLCIPGIRRYRSSAFGSVTTSHGTFVSDLDLSRNIPIVCR